MLLLPKSGVADSEEPLIGGITDSEAVEDGIPLLFRVTVESLSPSEWVVWVQSLPSPKHKACLLSVDEMTLGPS